MGCGVTAPCRGVAAGAERLRFCFVLQLCPVIDLVTRLVGIQLLGTVSGAFLVEQEVLPRRGPCGPVVGSAPSREGPAQSSLHRSSSSPLPFGAGL